MGVPERSDQWGGCFLRFQLSQVLAPALQNPSLCANRYAGQVPDTPFVNIQRTFHALLIRHY